MRGGGHWAETRDEGPVVLHRLRQNTNLPHILETYPQMHDAVSAAWYGATTYRATDQSRSRKRLGTYIVWEKMSFPTPPAFLHLQHRVVQLS
jgi:hypothetical protein